MCADIVGICEWNPGVAHSGRADAGRAGLGATRRREPVRNGCLNQEVVEFEPCRRLSFRVTDTNLPFESAVIRFRLEREDDGTTAPIFPDYRLKYGAVGQVADAPLVCTPYAGVGEGCWRGCRIMWKGPEQRHQWGHAAALHASARSRPARSDSPVQRRDVRGGACRCRGERHSFSVRAL